jgi:hypothetical protein
MNRLAELAEAGPLAAVLSGAQARVPYWSKLEQVVVEGR